MIASNVATTFKRQTMISLRVGLTVQESVRRVGRAPRWRILRRGGERAKSTPPLCVAEPELHDHEGSQSPPPACWDHNQIRVNGICMDYACHVSRSQHVCKLWDAEALQP